MHWFRPGRQQVLFFYAVAFGVALILIEVFN